MYGAVVVLLWSSRDLSFKINIWSAGQPFTYLFSFIVSFIKTKPNLMTSTFHDGKQTLGSNDWINTLLPTGRTSLVCISFWLEPVRSWSTQWFNGMRPLHLLQIVLQDQRHWTFHCRLIIANENCVWLQSQTNTSVWPLLSLLGSWWCPGPPCPTVRRSFVLPASQIPHHYSTPWDPPGVCWQ